MQIGMGALKLSRQEFWDMSFVEFWALYDFHFEKAEKPLSRNDYERMKKW